jgi:hypothetical protein
VTYQLRQIAQLEAIKALSYADPVARKEAFRLACEAALRDIAVARWRGEQPAGHIASLVEICVEASEPHEANLEKAAGGTEQHRETQEAA